LALAHDDRERRELDQRGPRRQQALHIALGKISRPLILETSDFADESDE
jgi:hypothetical protein